MLEAIGIAIVVLIWVVSTLIKGFKLLLRRTGTIPPPQAPPRSVSPAVGPNQPLGQGQFGAQPPPRLQTPPPFQKLPVRVQSESRERQPMAGGPAVPDETNRRDFERQEQELFASEPAALDVSLTSSPSRPSAAPNRLFGGTDDLIRAIILQEVLGPPLSRRILAPAKPSASTQTPP